jgi:hypothetical protein
VRSVRRRCTNARAARVRHPSVGVPGHADPIESGANFAALFGHAEPFEDDDGETWYHVLVDWMRVWRPMDYPDRQIPYNRIERELAGAIEDFPTTDGQSLLELEPKFLQLKAGKVTRQTVGPIKTKDLYDCLSVVASELMKDQLERRRVRARLAGIRLAAGAPGGYATSTAVSPPVDYPGARAMLERHRSRSRSQSRWPRG